MKRVHVNTLYRYKPVLLDRGHPPYNVREGDIVRVVNLPGCPKAGTMGHCHVEHPNGDFAGLVCCNSLEDLERTRAQSSSKTSSPTPPGTAAHAVNRAIKTDHVCDTEVPQREFR